MQSSNGQTRSIFKTSVHVDGRGSSSDEPATPALAHVHAVIHYTGSAPSPEFLAGLIGLHSKDVAFTPVDPKGGITVDVPPGDYHFEVGSEEQLSFVRQVIRGGKPLPANQIHLVANETAEFSLLVIRGSRTLTGFARKDGKPFAGALVLIFPANLAGNTDNPVLDQSNLDGSFQLARLAPGDYTLLAIEGGWDVEWHRPEVLARYLPGALTIHIADSAEKTQVLHEPLPVQPR